MALAVGPDAAWEIFSSVRGCDVARSQRPTLAVVGASSSSWHPTWAALTGVGIEIASMELDGRVPDVRWDRKKNGAESRNCGEREEPLCRLTSELAHLDESK